MSLSINIKDTILDFTQAKVMGILNVTSDSFFDGGAYNNVDEAIKHTKLMLDEGADIIDIGGYSSRPGADEVTLEEELERTTPVIKAISDRFDCVLSIDTFRAQVAQEAIEAGAHIVNDISAGDDDDQMISTVANLNVPYIYMHKKGSPKTMQLDPHYQDVVSEVYSYLLEKRNALNAAGISQLILDPGFGFGKTVEHNYKLLNNLSKLRELGLPILAGLSRKSMINKVLGTKAKDALNGTTFLHSFCLQGGANILRVHDVKEAVEAVKLWEAIQSNGQ